MKRRKTHNGENGHLQQRNNGQDDDYIPLPIQTFLWRQTSPFVRPFLVKKAREMAQLEQRDACKLFERIIITNNIWGQSPSLTDAIASIDRWRLIKVSFPFVLQCTAALLNNKLIKDHNFNRLGGNEAKMMYTLQWILMNASEECADSENEAKAKSANVAIAAATAASLLKPAPTPSSLAGSQTAGVACSQEAPVGSSQTDSGPARTTSSLLAARAAAAAASAALAGQPLATASLAEQQSQATGSPLPLHRLQSASASYSSPAGNQSSIILPAASTAATSALAVGAGSSLQPSVAAAALQMQQSLPSGGAASQLAPASSSSVSPINSTATPTKPLTPNPLDQSSASNYLLPIASIQMFVYYFAPIMDGLKHSDFLSSNQRLEIGAALWEPLFSHQLPANIQCLTAPVKPAGNCRSISPSSPTSGSFFAPAGSKLAARRHFQREQPLQSPDIPTGAASRRRSSAVQESSPQFGDVFLGASLTTSSSMRQAEFRSKRSEVVAAADAHSKRLLGTSHSPNQAEMNQLTAPEANYATYLDVAVLRCLFISDWQESGVFWALSFLANRLEQINYCERAEEARLAADFRSKSKSFSCLEDELLCLKSLRFRQQQASLESRTGGLPSKRTGHSRKSSAGGERQSGKEGKNFLRVEDAETSDDNPRDYSKSPVRRLSFSSGMQTLANQIRKSSKRVKKGSDSDGVTSDSQMSIQQAALEGSSRRPAGSQLVSRRSSSAEELNAGQQAELAKLRMMEDKENRVASPEMFMMDGSAPIITLSGSSKSQQQVVPSKKSRLAEKDTSLEPRPAVLGDDRKRLIERAHSKAARSLEELTRSQSVPDKLHFSPFERRRPEADQGESVGASHYIDNQARIDPIVVLKVLHSLSVRENACSQRVCDKILSLTLKLINIGILSDNYNFLRRSSTARSTGKKLKDLLPTRRHHHFKLLLQESAQVLKMDSDELLCREHQLEEAAQRVKLIHKILIDIVFRLQNHLGCPNHCGVESTVDQHHRNQHSKAGAQPSKLAFPAGDASGKLLRTKLRSSMDFLCKYNKANFITYVQAVVRERPIQQIVDMLHSILGFCLSDYLSNLQQVASDSGSILKPPSGLASLNSPHSEASACESAAQGCSKRPLPVGETVESLIVTNSFKQLITRLASINKELKLQENTSLYCDIRRLINLIRDNFNGVFRGIVLSALIDTTKLLNQQQRPRELRERESDDESNGHQLLPAARGSESSGQQAGEPAGLYDAQQPPRALELGASYSGARVAGGSQQVFDGSPQGQQRTSFGSCRYYPGAEQRPSTGKPVARAAQQQQQQEGEQHSQGGGILSLSKAKKKLEQVFGGGGAAGGSGLPGAGAKARGAHLGEELGQQAGAASSSGAGEAAGQLPAGSQTEEGSRRASLVGHQSMSSFHEPRQPANGQLRLDSPLGPNVELLIQSRQLYQAAQLGMSNFSFLMESCSPADFLDPALLAALLDLRSSIAVRAAIFLECANFVHRCNRGQWPTWMKMSVANFPRGSNTGILQGHSSKFRKSSSIQRSVRSNTLMYRAAGRTFYSWAEAVGARLEELLQSEQQELSRPDSSASASGEPGRDSSTLEQEAGERASLQAAEFQQQSAPPEVDFFQATLNNSSSPFALKMAACQLLFEVTTFLRETYRYLPPTIVHHQAGGAKIGDKMSSIYDVSRAVTANRRWSMALSSLGFGQFPALSAISGGAPASNAPAVQHQPQPQQQPAGSATMLRQPTTSVISEHPERRISFILHETQDETEQQMAEGSAESRPRDSQPDTNSSNAQSLSSPIAPSVNTNEQQEAAMRKLTSGRNLSQSSASSAVVVAAATCLLRSSGVIDGGTHRRKSIKLRKPAQEKESKLDKRAKFAQDLDEENENSSISEAGGVRRTDSMRSRRRVSGISEKSDTSDRQNGQQQPPHGPPGELQQQAEVSGDESAGNGSADEGLTNEASERIEADETRIMSNMPWFRAIALVNGSIDCSCSHFPACRENCYKLHQNMCKRLVDCVQSIYELEQLDMEANYACSALESQLAGLINQNSSQNNLNQHQPGSGHSQPREPSRGALVRAGSDCSASVLETSEQKLSKKERKAKKQQQQALESPHSASSPARNKKAASGAASKLEASPGGGISYMQPETLKALTAVKVKSARERVQRNQEEAQIVKYMKGGVRSLLHCPMSSFLKGAVILARDNFLELIRFSWSLLLEDDQQLSRTAAVGFIISAIKCPGEASRLLLEELDSPDASRKIAAIQKFYVIWDARYQCWPRLEDGAFVHFKMAPPSIEFTLPSPKIAQESRPVVDPPWMPRKTSNVEEVTIGQDQTVQKSFVTATKTRRKQQIEIVTRALREKHDKLREDRENYHITSVPITLYAAYEPTLSSQAAGSSGDELDGGPGATSAMGNADEDAQQENRALLQMKSAQALFPTCLCQAAIVMINLLDDSRVTYEGSAVYEIASKVIWSCLLEDPALFLRYFFERLTRQNQSTIFQVLRRLIRFMPRLPPQAAYTLYNYLIGFIIYYIRCPVESSQKLIADTLSVLCLVVPSVYGLFLKDLKQILRKEQCDHNLLITANVPSAKKIIVHGSDSSGIPSQFPIDESTQFYHILVDSLEFFGIEKPKQNDYFLIDVRSNHMHNVHSYVRDYYSFKRSQHPQLQLINMDSNKAFEILQKQELINQFLEFGKVSMSLSIVKSHHMAVQRVLFLHEELMKLPTFPRKAIETNFCLFRGPLGHQVFSMDRIHKICWVRVIARMFELTSGFFLQLGDIQLFLNAISGIFVLHCEEASVSRLCLATFINAAYQFKSIFASDGFMTIMATIVQVYSNHQNNQLLCRSIEFVCKQFYIMHRKPFLLQLFGSVASRLNTAELMQHQQTPLSASGHSEPIGYSMNNLFGSDPSRISPTAFFRLLQSLEKAFKDPLDILELVEAEKPLRAVDFCYQQDKEAIEILDIISLCVTVTAYASDSPRSTQMLIILETVVPLYIKFLSASTSKKAGQSMGKQAHKDELQKIQSISTCVRTLIVNCEGLTRNFSGPLPSIDFRSSSIRRTTGAAGAKLTGGQQRAQQANQAAGSSPLELYNAEEASYSGPGESAALQGSNRNRKEQALGEGGKQASIAPNAQAGGGYRSNKNFSAEESEIARAEFIVPRDTLLNLAAEFLSLGTGRLMESAKKYVELHQKHSSYELLDVKSHLRLAEVANSLLKFASTDPTVMACRGLIRYMNEILPNTEWRQEAIRPALIMILKRLDKTFNRIAKKSWVKRSTDWEGAKQLLKGAYLTFVKHPYIVHLPHLKSLISCCQNIILSDGLQSSGPVSAANLFHGFASASSNNFAASLQVSQSASVLSHGQPESRHTGNLLNVSGGQAGSALTASGSGPGLQAASAPVTAGQHHQGLPFSGSNVGERFAAAAAAVTAASNSSISSQGFNSVTIRLIAMQLLQTGDSQTLEAFVGQTAMNTPEKLESLTLNFLYPMCIRVCSGAKEAPKLRVCDIMYILNIVLNMLAPQSASSKSCSSTANSPKAATDTSQFILSKITTTIGSTQTGATALGIVGQAAHSTGGQHHQVAQHSESLKIGFLGLKILCVCFESQLASEWIRISRVIRDLALQQAGAGTGTGTAGGHTNQPSGPLWDFLDFVATYRFPMFVLLLPMIKCQLASRVREQRYLLDPQVALHNAQCQRLIGEKIHGSPAGVCRSKSFLFVSLTAELRMLKEQLMAKRRLQLESERQGSNIASQGGQQAGNNSLSPNQHSANVAPDGTSGDHSFTAYHRLSAALASFANQSTQAKTLAGAGSGNSQLAGGTSAALKGACFAAQLATSTPIGAQLSAEEARLNANLSQESHSQSSIRLSGAKTREEARKVMNTILRRTSFPHNQSLGAAKPTPEEPPAERKNSQPPSPGTKTGAVDLESGRASQIIMDPAMLMAAAFPVPRKSSALENSGILKQLVQTIDRNQKQRQQQSHLSYQKQTQSGECSANIPQTGSARETAASKSPPTNAAHKDE